ncbi:flagellar assembly protein FliH [Microbulbifer celer]|uniref:Flagellar assembly protein FliH n=1 Tax=Microbulbifer celer TaxID=435905 RepID=A0ABW3U4I5_9GAMM|nr:flagellar assembly protein FliH [Microbulbifer celer]UFN57838.1 flagellar assembly protein FliH [Microbulbifer celer]
MSEAVSWRRWQPEDLSGERQRRAASECASKFEKLRDQARSEGLQQGYDAGFAEGYERGLAEGRAAGTAETDRQRHELLSPLATLAKDFSHALNTVDDSIAEEVTALALAVGRRLADEALQAQPQQVATLVRRLLREAPTFNGSERARLWLNPEDLPLVKQELETELASAGWDLDQDPQLARGGCRITTATGEIDASRDTRWQALMARIHPTCGRVLAGENAGD